VNAWDVSQAKAVSGTLTPEFGSNDIGLAKAQSGAVLRKWESPVFAAQIFPVWGGKIAVPQ
jgi:hypothetical protein